MNILLRLFSVLLIKIFSQFKHRSLININNNTGILSVKQENLLIDRIIFYILGHRLTRFQSFSRWTKRINMFKSGEDKTATAIKQQRITTYLYLILFTSMHVFYTSLIRKIVESKYKRLFPGNLC
jgi:hypothetical protein